MRPTRSTGEGGDDQLEQDLEPATADPDTELDRPVEPKEGPRSPGVDERRRRRRRVRETPDGQLVFYL